jgi:hypothetical protein
VNKLETRLFGNLGVACVIACAAWRCHASALFLGALTLPKNPRFIRFTTLQSVKMKGKDV